MILPNTLTKQPLKTIFYIHHQLNALSSIIEPYTNVVPSIKEQEAIVSLVNMLVDSYSEFTTDSLESNFQDLELLSASVVNFIGSVLQSIQVIWY